jgi:FixJ family two-component response regulator
LEHLENRVSTRIAERGTIAVSFANGLEFLTKPFRDQELLDAIQEAIQRDCANRKHQAEIAE